MNFILYYNLYVCQTTQTEIYLYLPKKNTRFSREEIFYVHTTHFAQLQIDVSHEHGKLIESHFQSKHVRIRLGND